MSRDLTFRIMAKNLVKAGVDGAVKAIGGLRAQFSRTLAGGLDFMGKLGLAGMGLSQVFHVVAKGAHALWGALEKSFQFERYAVQFEVLLGSVDKAKAHIADLAKFAAATPFEMPEIADASRQLMVLTGGVMGGAASLRLVGDAASVAGVSISEVAMWVGRAYDAIKAGKPFGHAAMRLQEMGILTAEARNKMEDLQAAGASAADTYAVLQDALGRYAGGME